MVLDRIASLLLAKSISLPVAERGSPFTKLSDSIVSVLYAIRQTLGTGGLLKMNPPPTYLPQKENKWEFDPPFTGHLNIS